MGLDKKINPEESNNNLEDEKISKRTLGAVVGILGGMIYAIYHQSNEHEVIIQAIECYSKIIAGGFFGYLAGRGLEYFKK